MGFLVFVINVEKSEFVDYKRCSNFYGKCESWIGFCRWVIFGGVEIMVGRYFG